MKVFLFTISLFIPFFSWSLSVPTGQPNRGALQDGENINTLIKSHPDVLHSVSPAEYQYGTTQMADTILSIGNWAKEFNRQPVWVGDISKKGGGKLAQHKTHQRGLDADVAYLVYQHQLSGHRSDKFNDRFTEQFGLKGQLGNNFDIESNYSLFEKLFHEPTTFKIFVGCGIYDALEAYDKKKPSSIMKHIFAEKGHEDHFHIRLKCPKEATDCSEQWWDDPNAKPRKKKPKDHASHEKYHDC